MLQVTEHDSKILSKAKPRGQNGIAKVDHPGGHVLMATRHRRGSHPGGQLNSNESLRCLNTYHCLFLA
jgi:hypothetical protein